MDKAVTTSIFVAVGMILAMMLYNVVYPAAIEGGDAISSMTDRVTNRMRTQIAVIHATGELDPDGNWQDANGNGVFEATFWIKNIGETRITPVETLDVFFGPEGNFARIPHEATVSGSYPRWRATIETGNDWVPRGTLRLDVQYSAALPEGRYFFKISLPNGVYDEVFLGI